MVTVFWSPFGFFIVEALVKRKILTSDYFCETICLQFVEYTPLEMRQPRGRQLTVHMDDACPHRQKQITDCLTSSRLGSTPHPPYSPDLAPPDFYLCGKVKNLLIGKKFASANELLQEISRILEAIRRGELDAAFAGWEKILRKCITLDGEYLDSVHSKNGINSLISVVRLFRISSTISKAH
jgi:transposase